MGSQSQRNPISRKCLVTSRKTSIDYKFTITIDKALFFFSALLFFSPLFTYYK